MDSFLLNKESYRRFQRGSTGTWLITTTQPAIVNKASKSSSFYNTFFCSIFSIHGVWKYSCFSDRMFQEIGFSSSWTSFHTTLCCYQWIAFSSDLRSCIRIAWDLRSLKLFFGFTRSWYQSKLILKQEPFYNTVFHVDCSKLGQKCTMNCRPSVFFILTEVLK